MLDPLPFPEITPNFCPRDGTPLGDELKAGVLRRVCPTCGYIYGRDPHVILGLLITWGDDIVFVRRLVSGKETWSLPLYPCRDREDARVMAATAFDSETGLHAQVASVEDAFNVDDSDLGPVLVLLFRAILDRSIIEGNSRLTSFTSASALTLTAAGLTHEILMRLDAVRN